MIIKEIDRDNCSIKKVLLENSHYVIYNNLDEVYFSDANIKQELAEIGITDKMLFNIMDSMNQNVYYIPNQTNPIYQCVTLYPAYNLSFTYPYFIGTYLEYYIDDILEANALMKTDTIYFSYHSKNDKDRIIEILKKKASNKKITIYFIT